MSKTAVQALDQPTVSTPTATARVPGHLPSEIAASVWRVVPPAPYLTGAAVILMTLLVFLSGGLRTAAAGEA